MKDDYYNYKYTFSTLTNSGRISVFADDITSARAKARAALGITDATLPVYRIKELKNVYSRIRGQG